MKIKTLKADGLLLFTSAIWGFAFVAQRVGMEYIGPFTFNGIRFALGCFVLLPLILRKGSQKNTPIISLSPAGRKTLIFGGGLLGVTLFAAASVQQVGLVYTTAGNAGFITGLYVVIVPILGLFWGHRLNAGTWGGALLAAMGLYFLSVTDELTMSFGDVLELIGAFLWAMQILIVGWLSPKIDPIKLAFAEFSSCSFLSLITAVIFEEFVLKALLQAAIPILYGGVFSVGVAFTLQVVAQKNAHPAHAAIFFSLESVFAAFGGWLILNETISYRGLVGCTLMLSGMLLSQLKSKKWVESKKKSTIML